MLTITSSDITLQTSRCAHLALQSATECRDWMFSTFIALEYSHLVEMVLVTICEIEHAQYHIHIVISLMLTITSSDITLQTVDVHTLPSGMLLNTEVGCSAYL